MKHTEILKRSWHTMLQYRALWFFGFILALTTVSGSAVWHGGRDNDHDYRPPQTSRMTFDEDARSEWREAMKTGNAEFDQKMEEFEQRFANGIPADVRNTIITRTIPSPLVVGPSNNGVPVSIPIP